jgi:hypothetical protein
MDKAQELKYSKLLICLSKNELRLFFFKIYCQKISDNTHWYKIYKIIPVTNLL